MIQNIDFPNKMSSILQIQRKNYFKFIIFHKFVLMNPDVFFKRLEQRTEQELYRRSFKAATQSQDSLFKQFENKKREEFKVAFAREVKWFFASLILAPLMGFIFYYIFANVIKDTMIDLAKYFDGVETLYFIIVGISLVGIYVARIILWALKR